MNKGTFSFLKSVLGVDGATAMRRAVAKDPGLEAYLIPRTILGWALNKTEFEGVLPGLDSVYIEFKKSEGQYSGNIGQGSQPVKAFTAENEYHLVAELIQAIGYELPSFSGSDRTLSFLGKSVDALIKAKHLTGKLSKGVDLPGSAAKPQEHGAPEAPTPPSGPTTGVGKAKTPVVNVPNSPVGASSSGVLPKNGVPVKLPKKKKLPVIKVEVNELSKACATCSGVMFKSEKFIGCMCWRDLAKYATTVNYSDGVVVEFSPSADRLTVLALHRELSQ